jgi:hypothetical protein
MKDVDMSRMEELFIYRQRLLERMETVVDDLRAAALDGLFPESSSDRKEGQPSPHWWLAHLRNIEAQALAPRMKRILTEEEPLLSLFDDEDWMDKHYRLDEPIEAIVDDYERIRKGELAWLNEMKVQAWSRTCRHPWFGVRTLQWWVERTLAYAEEHLQEITPG